MYTRPQEVNAMLDLVSDQCERITSRFLEPACGTGNFLLEILRRKLAVVRKAYKRSQVEYERNAVSAVGSIYGIELLPDNVEQCRTRLFELVEREYRTLFKRHAKPRFLRTIHYILTLNIVHGDALEMTAKTQFTLPESLPPSLKALAQEAIIFPHWSFVSDNLLKRHDYLFDRLVNHGGQKCGKKAQKSALTPSRQNRQADLFSDEAVVQDDDPSRSFFQYPPTHYLEIADAYPIEP
ncbi:DNA methyltransferase family protein [Spirabiliibacterium pneumoniae]|uniref:DNA methyltransferase n=1 Tax=Spirabiliibacterium pneumoniae TaxID=221400 RepID=UPI001AAD9789|nr:DNA methyltransferase [Spirabiliibacterium pneumoniae]